MSKQHYEYKTVNITGPSTAAVEIAANSWASDGWEVVSVYPKPRPGFFDITEMEMLVKRVLIDE